MVKLFKGTWEIDGKTRVAYVPTTDADTALAKLEEKYPNTEQPDITLMGDLAPLGTFEAESIFLCPWKPHNANIGRVRRIGIGSVDVHVPNQDGDGWSQDTWAPSTLVLPLEDREQYTRQTFGSSTTVQNKSKVSGPVAIVHEICDEMEGDRKAILEECEKRGINPNTAKTQYYAWRKQNAEA